MSGGRARRPAALPLVRLAAAAALTAATLMAAGCGDKSTEPPPSTTPSVQVTPSSASVMAGDSLHLSAAAANLASAQVTWSLTRLTPTPASADLGTLVVTGPTTALYVAPARVEGFFDYQIRVTARSVSDTTVSGGASLTVPRVHVTVVPGSLASVLPGTLVPYEVKVLNALDPGFRLYVQGIEGGDEQVGLWTQTGPQAAIFEAPQAVDFTRTNDLLVRSVQDTTRFATSIITLRRGFPLTLDPPAQGQFVPAWRPGEVELAFVRGGAGAWEVVIRTLGTAQERTVATLAWSGAEYDGQLDWSSDGTLLAFSEEVAGRRVIGLVEATGAGRRTFAPVDGQSYLEAAFVPRPSTSMAPESLVVSREAGVGLRAYPVNYVAGENGRAVFVPPVGSTARWPDVVRLDAGGGATTVYVACTLDNGAFSDVLTFVDDGVASSRVVVAPGTGHRSHVRFARQSSGPLWVTYLWDVTSTYYRVGHRGDPPAHRLYSEFFPQLAADLSTAPAFDAHAISRRAPGAVPRIWVVEFPPSSFDGVPRPEEVELASIGIRGAIPLSGWRRWLGTYTPRIGPVAERRLR